MSEQELKELRERNEKRLIEAKIKLGEKWLMHPVNRIYGKRFTKS